MHHLDTCLKKVWKTGRHCSTSPKWIFAKMNCSQCLCSKSNYEFPTNRQITFPSVRPEDTQQKLSSGGKQVLEEISSTIQKLPYFVLSFSVMEIIFYYAADEDLKRLFMYDADNETEIWRFITYMLVHTDPVHLGLNVIVQGVLGASLELEQGRVRCAAVYLGGGLGGSLTASFFPELSLMAGASAGIYALLLSQIPNTVLNRGSLKYARYRIVAVLTLIFSDLIYVCYHVYFCKNENPKIGWVAHVSGAATGFLLGFSTFKGTCSWRRKSQIISCALLTFLFGVSLMFIIFY